MKQLRNTILLVVMSMCSFMGYASEYDTDYITIPESYINNTGQTFLLEKAAHIFRHDYRLTLTNIYLSESWFCCDIVIENFDDEVDVTQQCGNEYPQSVNYDPGTSSSLKVTYEAYDIVVHSEVRLQGTGDEQNIKVTYHFTDTWKQDDYYLVITFPYNKKTWTSIGSIECEPTSVEYYDIQGRKHNGPQPGIVIEKQGNKTTKKIYR